MSSDEDAEYGMNATKTSSHQRQGVGTTTAAINDLAGNMSNTNVNGMVGPNFFVARLHDEATTLALYGYLKSESCILGLQGKVQLPGEVNCALHFLELFRKNKGHQNQSAVSFGKLTMHNVRKDEPDAGPVLASEWPRTKIVAAAFDPCGGATQATFGCFNPRSRLSPNGQKKKSHRR